MIGKKTAFDMFMRFFDAHLTARKTHEQAFEDAVNQWRIIYDFEPPCKNYESFRVKRSILIKSKAVSDGSAVDIRVTEDPSTYASLFFS